VHVSAAERRPIMLALDLAALTGWKFAWGSTRLAGVRRRSSLDDEAYLISKLGLYEQ
jgi:hypothetical protein